MRAVTWQGRRKVSVDTVPDPAIKEPTDANIRITSTNICGSDLHRYEVLGAFMSQDDILGHEAMGVVEEVGREVDTLTVPAPRCSATPSSPPKSPAARPRSGRRRPR